MLILNKKLKLQFKISIIFININKNLYFKSIF